MKTDGGGKDGIHSRIIEVAGGSGGLSEGVGSRGDEDWKWAAGVEIGKVISFTQKRDKGL